MDGVAGELGIGDVALDAAHGELAAQGAAAAVLDHVARALDRGGLTHDAIVERLTTRAELLHHHLRAIHGRAFFVAGQQESDVERCIRVRGQKLLHCHHKRGNGRLHVAGATAVQLAVLVGGGERVTAPLGQRACGHHVGMACKYYGFDS